MTIAYDKNFVLYSRILNHSILNISHSIVYIHTNFVNKMLSINLYFFIQLFNCLISFPLFIYKFVKIVNNI